MNKQKLFLAATSVTLAAVAVATPVAADSYTHSFKDVNSRYDEAVSFFYEVGIINGVSATEFGTYQPLTRGDAAVILANTLMLDTESAPDAGFTDVNSRIKGSVNALAEAGIISGVSKTEFKPNELLSRGAMAKILVKAFALEEYATETPFSDAAGVFAPYIEALYGTQITSGTTATTYGTTANIKRGDFANLLYNTYWFAVENSYYPVPESAIVTSPTATQITLTEAVPAEYGAQEIADYLWYTIVLEDGTEVDFQPTAYMLSPDRTVLTLQHANFDLTGKAGTVYVEDYEIMVEAPFDFK